MESAKPVPHKGAAEAPPRKRPTPSDPTAQTAWVITSLTASANEAAAALGRVIALSGQANASIASVNANAGRMRAGGSGNGFTDFGRSGRGAE